MRSAALVRKYARLRGVLRPGVASRPEMSPLGSGERCEGAGDPAVGASSLQDLCPVDGPPSRWQGFGNGRGGAVDENERHSAAPRVRGRGIAGRIHFSDWIAILPFSFLSEFWGVLRFFGSSGESRVSRSRSLYPPWAPIQGMPPPRDRRLVRSGDAGGYEIYLVKKSNTSQRWVALTPEDKIYEVGTAGFAAPKISAAHLTIVNCVW